MLTKIREYNKRLISVSLVFLMIISLIQIVQIDVDPAGNADALDDWTEDDSSHFNAGDRENLKILYGSSDSMYLTDEVKYFEDYFNSETYITQKENLIVDTTNGEIKLLNRDGVFKKEFGDSEDQIGYCVQNTSDGGFIVVGDTSPSPNTHDVWLLKIDSSGNLLWSKTYGGTHDDRGRAVRQTSDGGYIITGYTQTFSVNVSTYDVWLIKTDSSGVELWNKTFGGPYYDYGYDIQETADDGFIIAGVYSPDKFRRSLWMVKTNSNGDMVWNRTYGTNTTLEYGYSIQQTGDGGYIVAGSAYTLSGFGNDDFWLIKTNETGSMVWNSTFGGVEDDEARSVLETTDGGFIVAGYTKSFGTTDPDVWLIKTDSSGSEVWKKRFGGTGFEYGNCVNETPDGGFMIAGTLRPDSFSSEEMYVLRTDSSGNKKWDRSYPSVGTEGNYLSGTPDGGFVITGSKYYTGSGYDDLILVKINGTGDCENAGYLYSTDIQSGHRSRVVRLFNYTASIPSQSSIKVQFSKDGQKWFNDIGNENYWTYLDDGFNSLDISFSQNPDFYYRLKITSQNMADPVFYNTNMTWEKCYSNGKFTSQVNNFGGKVNPVKIDWDSYDHPDTMLRFQLRTGTSVPELLSNNFVGPDGNTGSYYETPNTNIWTGHDDMNYLQYRVFFSTTNGSVSPGLNAVTITFNNIPGAPVPTTPTNNMILRSTEPTFRWNFIDADPDIQIGLQWQMDDSIDFISVEYDSGLVISDKPYYLHSELLEQGKWFWRVRTQDFYGDWGPFCSPAEFTIDSEINRPESVSVVPDNWASTDTFNIDWMNPDDDSGILTGAYYYLSHDPPVANSNGTWQSSKPFNVTIADNGEINIYIWLKDLAGNYDFQKYKSGTLKLDRKAPTFEHDPVTEWPVGEDIQIKTNITDVHSGVSTATLYYQEGANENFKSISMVAKSNSYSAVIPSTEITGSNIKYYLAISDNAQPPNTVYFGSDGASSTKPTNAGSIEIKIIEKKTVSIGFAKVIDHTPTGENVDVNSWINITFNSTMDTSSAEDGFSITPDAHGSFIWNGNTLMFKPQYDLRYNYQYTITISKDVLDDGGNSMEDDHTWTFKTGSIGGDNDDDGVDADGRPKFLEGTIFMVSILLIIAVIVILIIALVIKGRKKPVPATTPPGIVQTGSAGPSQPSYVEPPQITPPPVMPPPSVDERVTDEQKLPWAEQQGGQVQQDHAGDGVEDQNEPTTPQISDRDFYSQFPEMLVPDRPEETTGQIPEYPDTLIPGGQSQEELFPPPPPQPQPQPQPMPQPQPPQQVFQEYQEVPQQAPIQYQDQAQAPQQFPDQQPMYIGCASCGDLVPRGYTHCNQCGAPLANY